ncbi:hypothetical protein HK405_001755, partial [Cladochytrium tenue]
MLGVESSNFCLASCSTGKGVTVTAPSLLAGVTVGALQLIFDSSDPWNPKVNSSATVKLTIPAALGDIDLQITGAGGNIGIVGPDGVEAAVLVVDDYSSAASGSSASAQVILPLLPSHGDHVSASNTQSAFGNFLIDVITTTGDVAVTMSGYADTKAVATSSSSTKSIDVCLKYVPLNAGITLTGLGNLQDASISNPQVLGGSPSTGIGLT